MVSELSVLHGGEGMANHSIPFMSDKKQVKGKKNKQGEKTLLWAVFPSDILPLHRTPFFLPPSKNVTHTMTLSKYSSID
jgi:hypothetical protein